MFIVRWQNSVPILWLLLPFANKRKVQCTPKKNWKWLWNGNLIRTAILSGKSVEHADLNARMYLCRRNNSEYLDIHWVETELRNKNYIWEIDPICTFIAFFFTTLFQNILRQYIIIVVELFNLIIKCKLSVQKSNNVL